MKIGIAELYYHSESLQTMLELFSEETVDVYTTDKIKNDLDKNISNTNIYTKQDKQSNKDFITNIPTEKYDLFFINTIQESYLNGRDWIDFKPRCKSILTVHNVNAWKYKKFIRSKNMFHSVDSFMFSKISDKILNNFDYLGVDYKPMVNTAEDLLGKKTVFIPATISQNSKYKYVNEYIKFVVPGTVDKTRRSYKEIIGCFENLSLLHHNIKLYLLGELKDFKHLKKNENFITYPKFVDQIEYNYQTSHCDMIIVPAVEQTHTVNMTTEFYGVSKSPNIHSAIRYKKPLIIPSYIPVDRQLLSSTIKYNNQVELINKIDFLLTNPSKLKEISIQAKKNMETYNKCNIKKQLMKNLNQ